jgi:uncharacterized protein (DUF433 family)
MPVSAIFENLEAGFDIDEIVEQFHVDLQQLQAVLEFAAPIVVVGKPTEA